MSDDNKKPEISARGWRLSRDEKVFKNLLFVFPPFSC